VKGKETDKRFTWRQYFDAGRNRHYYSNLAVKKNVVWYLPDVEKKEEESVPEPEQTTQQQLEEENKRKQAEEQKLEEQRLEEEEKKKQEEEEKKKKFEEELKRNTNRRMTLLSFMSKNRSSFTSSFTENPSNPNASDDFNNFASAASDIPTEGHERLRMRSGSVFDDMGNRKSFIGSLTRSNSIIVRPTVTLENMKFNKKELAPGRAELEDHLEEELFRGMGQGENHVLCAVRCYQFHNEKNKKERVIAIVRDYSGAYGLFFANLSTKKGSKKFQNIAASIPMLHFYDMNNLHSERDNIRFTLMVDGTEVDIMTHNLLREKLKRGLETAFKQIKQKRNKDLQLYRMTSIDFAMTHSVERPRMSREQLMYELVTLIKKTKNPEEANLEMDELFHVLRVSLRDGNDREFFIEQLCDFTNSKDFQARYVIICGQILDSILKTPSPPMPFTVDRADRARNNILKMISKWNRFQVLDDSVTNGLIEEVEDVFMVMRGSWKARGNLPDVPFTADFFRKLDGLSIQQTKAKEKERKNEKKMRESMVANMLGQGVFLSVVLFTPEGEILGDARENLPSIQLPNLNYSEVTDMLVDSEDQNFEWLMRYGVRNFSKMLSQLERDMKLKRRIFSGVTNTIVLQEPIDVRERGDSIASLHSGGSGTEEQQQKQQLVHHSRFRTSMCKAVFELSNNLGVDNFGCLYDKLVKIRGNNMASLLAVRKIEDKNTISVPNNYKWYQMFDFEHKLYQKYEGIDELFQMERLGDDYYGRRWLFGSILHDHSLRSRMREGFYIGYLCVTHMQDGYHVLINDIERYMIPNVYVWRSSPTEEQWQWIQTVRIRLKEGKPFLEDQTLMEKIDPFTPDYQVSGTGITLFQQYFYRAYLQLQKTMGDTDLGVLYDLELINLDESGRTKMVVFCKYVSQRDMLPVVADPTGAAAEEYKKKLSERIDKIENVSTLASDSVPTPREDSKEDEKRKRSKKKRADKKKRIEKLKKAQAERHLLRKQSQQHQKFIWRKGDVFELLFYQVFRPNTFELYMKSYRRDLYCENLWVNDSHGFVTDEALRLRKSEGAVEVSLEKGLQAFVKKEQTWTPLRWILRIIHWLANLQSRTILEVGTMLSKGGTKIDSSDNIRDQDVSSSPDLKRILTEANQVYRSTYDIPTIESIIKSEVDRMEPRNKLDSSVKESSEEIQEPDWRNIEAKIWERMRLTMPSQPAIAEEKKEEEETINWLEEDDEDLEKLICSVYNVDVVIEDIRDIETLKLVPTKDELTDNMTQEMYEKSMIRTLDAAELSIIEDVVFGLVDILEVTDELVQMTVLEDRMQDTVSMLNAERDSFQKAIMNVMDRVLEEDMSFTDRVRLQKKAAKGSDSINMRNILDEQLSEHDFTYNPVVRKMIKVFDQNMDHASKLLEVIRSGKETNELIETMYVYEKSMENQEQVDGLIEEQWNRVPRTDLMNIGTTRKERKFVTYNGSRPISLTMLEVLDDDGSDVSFLQQQENDLEATLKEQERIKSFIEEQTQIEKERARKSKTAMKSAVDHSPFGYQGFSLPYVPNTWEEARSRQASGIFDEEQTPTKTNYTHKTPISDAHKSPIYYMHRASRQSKNNGATSNSPPDSSNKERKDWFGYVPPESLSEKVKLQMQKKKEEQEKQQKKLFDKYKSQHEVVSHLGDLIGTYSSMKKKSSQFLYDDYKQTRKLQRMYTGDYTAATGNRKKTRANTQVSMVELATLLAKRRGSSAVSSVTGDDLTDYQSSISSL
jgi:hypothetical protein